MCYILAPKPTYDLTEQQLSNAYASNSNNAGFAYVKHDKVIVRKGYKSFETFYSAYSSVGTDCPRLVHFANITDPGLRTLTNCHPFELIRDDLCMAHHGFVFNINSTNEHTESNLLVKEVIKPLLLNKTYKYVRNSHVRWLLDEAIGTNRIVFLDKDGLFTIINPQEGNFDKDNNIWYSAKFHEWTPIRSVVDKNNTSLTNKTGLDEKYDVWLDRVFGEYVNKKGEGKNVIKNQEEKPVKKYKSIFPYDSNVRFSVGDPIICMDPRDNLVKYGEYIVQEVNEVETKQYLKVFNLSLWFMSNRFVHKNNVVEI